MAATDPTKIVHALKSHCGYYTTVKKAVSPVSDASMHVEALQQLVPGSVVLKLGVPGSQPASPSERAAGAPYAVFPCNSFADSLDKRGRDGEPTEAFEEEEERGGDAHCDKRRASSSRAPSSSSSVSSRLAQDSASPLGDEGDGRAVDRKTAASANCASTGAAAATDVDVVVRGARASASARLLKEQQQLRACASDLRAVQAAVRATARGLEPLVAACENDTRLSRDHFPDEDARETTAASGERALEEEEEDSLESRSAVSGVAEEVQREEAALAAPSVSVRLPLAGGRAATATLAWLAGTEKSPFFPNSPSWIGYVHGRARLWRADAGDERMVSARAFAQ